jgi:hypothetical protein
MHVLSWHFHYVHIAPFSIHFDSNWNNPEKHKLFRLPLAEFQNRVHPYSNNYQSQW